MVGWVTIALLAIATNAVLIQTVIDEQSNVKNLVRIAVLAVTVVMLILRRVFLPLWMLALVALSGLLYLATGNSDQLTVIFVLLVVPALWAIPERSLERIAVVASVFALVLVFVFLATGLTTNELRISQTPLSDEIRRRNTFGTNGVPFFMNVVYGAAAFMIFYSYRWRLRGRLVIVALALAGVTYLYTQTDGRGGFIAVLIFSALLFVLPHLVKLPIVPTLLALQPIIFTAITFWLASQRDNPQANLLLSYRPMLYGQFLDSVTFTDLWTSTSVKTAADVSTVDSSMFHLLYGGGIIIFAAFCFLFARAVLFLISRRMYIHLAFLSSAMIYGMSESILMRVENIFILFCWYIVLRYALKQPEGTN